MLGQKIPSSARGHKLDKAHTRTSGASAGLHIEGDVAPESRKARQENNPVLSKIRSSTGTLPKHLVEP